MSFLFCKFIFWSGVDLQRSVSFCVCSQSLSRVQLFLTPWTAAHQAPLPMGFCRQEYWNGLPCPPRKSSRPRDWTHVSCIADWFLPLSHLGSPVLASTVQQSDSVIYIYIFFFIFFSTVVYYRILTIVNTVVLITPCCLSTPYIVVCWISFLFIFLHRYNLGIWVFFFIS